MRTFILVMILIFGYTSAHANEYYNKKWFDFPDPGTLPKVTQNGCGKQACTKVPVFHGPKITFEERCVCINPLMKTELLRKDVRVIVSGPDTADQAVKNTLVGYAAGCVATATAASTMGPQVVAAPAGFFGAFKACLTALSVSGIAGGIMNQFAIRFDTSATHWSPL